MAETNKTRSIGLKVAQFGDVNPEGGMPAVMKRLARTLKGTASFTTENIQSSCPSTSTKGTFGAPSDSAATRA